MEGIGGSCRPAQSDGSAMNMDTASSGDWKTQLHPDARTRIVNKIMDTVQMHLPIYRPENLGELRKIATRFEDKIFTVAISQTDYLRKICLKMLSLESKTQNTGSANQMASNTPNQNASEGSLILQPKVQNTGQTLQMSMTNQSQTHQQPLAQGIQNNLSTMAPAVSGLPQTVSSISQTSNFQTVPSISQTSLQQGQAPVMHHQSQPSVRQQSSSSLLLPHPQAVLWQQQTQPSSGLSREPSLQHQQQQQQLQLLGNHANMSNLQQSRLLGHQNSISDMQQQLRFTDQQGNLMGMQQRQPRTSPPGRSGVQATNVPSWARQRLAAHPLFEVEAASHSSSTRGGSRRLRAPFWARRRLPRAPFKPRRLRSRFHFSGSSGSPPPI